MRIRRLRIAVYPNDHRPPHVHVIGPDAEAVFRLNCPDGPPELRSNVGFALAHLNRIHSNLAAHIEDLCHAWHKIHGYH